MSQQIDYLHRHGWRLAGTEMRNCKKTPLWKKTGIPGTFSTEEACERQHAGNSYDASKPCQKSQSRRRYRQPSETKANEAVAQ